uniref:Si:ch73-180n10.1 n=1 Tax=Salmo trutta TaxID=8032 RepID=A0A674CME2_SALTR
MTSFSVSITGLLFLSCLVSVYVISLVGSTSLVYPPNHGEEDIVWSSEEEDSMRPFDPCFRYTVLDQPWRATNTSIKNKMCDRNVKWRGWYRLFYKGNSLQMPERCVPMNKCGTHAPMWLAGPHPKRRDGIVTRKVCGHWNKNCCAFKSTPIKVKKCQGNYYVYKFTKPTTCHLAYCAGKIEWETRCQDRPMVGDQWLLGGCLSHQNQESLHCG